MPHEAKAKKPESVEPPDIPYFARKGGWKSSDPEGYWFGAVRDLHSGNSTAAYSYCAILGVAKEIEDVQHFCASRAPNAKPGDVHKVFPKLPDGLLKRAVAAVHVAEAPVRTPSAEIARQMAAQWFNEEVCKNEPKLKQWPPEAPASVPTTEPPQLKSHTEQIAARVERKLANPAGNPLMSIEEGAQALSKSLNTIRRYLGDGKLAAGGIPGRVTTKSVKDLIDSGPPKDEYQLAEARRDKALSELKRTAKTLTAGKYTERKRAIENAYDAECQHLDEER